MGIRVGQQIVYVAYGQKAIQEVSLSIKSLRKHNSYPITVVCDKPLNIEDVLYVKFKDESYGARWAKLNIDNLVNSNIIGYLDADTRVHGSLEPAFNMVKNGWDMVLSYSINQGSDVLKHIDNGEREATLAEISNPFPLQLQCGVMFFNRLRCKKFFERWRFEWRGKKDQAAFLRTLDECPIKIALLGRPWNGGSVIEHLFGRAHG